MVREFGISKRAPRVDLRRPAVLIDSDGREHNVTILDVSSGGFRLEVTEAPRIGEFIHLRVERGDEFPAQIRWALGNEAGGVFLTQIGSEVWSAGGRVMDQDRSDRDDRRKGELREAPDRRRTGRQEPDRREGARRT